MSKLYFFKLEPSQLLAALIQVPKASRGAWITQVALELASGEASNPFAAQLITEAREYQSAMAERNRLAGLASAAKRNKQALNGR